MRKSFGKKKIKIFGKLLNIVNTLLKICFLIEILFLSQNNNFKVKKKIIKKTNVKVVFNTSVRRFSNKSDRLIYYLIIKQ